MLVCLTLVSTELTLHLRITYIAFGCLVSVTLYHGLCDSVL